MMTPLSWDHYSDHILRDQARTVILTTASKTNLIAITQGHRRTDETRNPKSSKLAPFFKPRQKFERYTSHVTHPRDSTTNILAALPQQTRQKLPTVPPKFVLSFLFPRLRNSQRAPRCRFCPAGSRRVLPLRSIFGRLTEIGCLHARFETLTCQGSRATHCGILKAFMGGY
jgi:hypothetical protein